MRRSWPACGIVAAVLLVSGCTAGSTGGAATAEQPEPGFLAVADTAAPAGGTLEMQMYIDTADGANGLDPQASDLATSWQLMSLVYETLVTIGPTFEIEPLLAERWETPSPTRYVFHLRDDVVFSNGRPMTADDVVGSMERLLAGATVWRGQIGPVESVRKLDEHTVEFTLTSPYTPFLAAMANVPAAVLRGNYHTGDGTRHHPARDYQAAAVAGEPTPAAAGNTTLTVLVTNVRLDDHQLGQLARQVHSSMHRAIQPFHTANDGDVLFALTTDDVELTAVTPTGVGTLASEVAWDAVLSSAA